MLPCRSLNLQTLSQSGLIAPPAGAEAVGAPVAAPDAQAGAAAAQQEQAVQQVVQQVRWAGGQVVGVTTAQGGR